MPIAKADLSVAAITTIRQQYADGVVLRNIIQDNDVSKETIYYCVDGGPHDPEPRYPPLPRRRTRPRADNAHDSNPARRILVQRLWRTASQQVKEIQSRLHSIGQESSERDARALAVLVKTLRDLAAFDEANPAAQTRTDSDDDDYDPRDMDEFRRELARKMDAIIARRTERVSGDSESGAD
jgi:hypothetical protein